MRSLPHIVGNFCHWCACFNSIIKTCTKNSGDDANDQSFYKIEFFYAFFLFFFRQFFFFQNTCPAADINSNQTQHNTNKTMRPHEVVSKIIKSCFARLRMKVVINRWNECAKCGCKTKQHRIAKTHSKIAHAESIH